MGFSIAHQCPPAIDFVCVAMESGHTWKGSIWGVISAVQTLDSGADTRPVQGPILRPAMVGPVLGKKEKKEVLERKQSSYNRGIF